MGKFKIDFKSSPSAIVAEIANKIKDKGGEFTGDEVAGKFTIVKPVTIKGEYKIDGQTIVVDITKKPMFVTTSMVESEIIKDVQKVDAENGDLYASK